MLQALELTDLAIFIQLFLRFGNLELYPEVYQPVQQFLLIPALLLQLFFFTPLQLSVALRPSASPQPSCCREQLFSFSRFLKTTLSMIKSFYIKLLPLRILRYYHLTEELALVVTWSLKFRQPCELVVAGPSEQTNYYPQHCYLPKIIKMHLFYPCTQSEPNDIIPCNSVIFR